MILLFKRLLNNLGYVVLIAFLISRFRVYRNIIQKEKFTLKDLVLLSLVFGTFGILGTYIGTPVNGAIANTRIIGVITGGILFGPLVGVLSGVIAGLHRLLIDIGGITSVPCFITTILAGIAGGIVNRKSTRKNRWIHGLFSGIIIEHLTMLFIIILSRPFDLALDIVRQIYLPMTLINGIGVGIVISITESIFEEKEEIAARQAKLALEIANKTMPYFKNINQTSFREICKIIKDSIGADAVSITNRTTILAHYGLGEDHHIEKEKILTGSTKYVIENKEILVLKDQSQIECAYKNCPLKSAIIVPLTDEHEVIGTLKIYYKNENAITFRDEHLAVGLSQLISTQLKISKMQELEKMANEAEIRALQAQINPHFLFNALNTIVSFIRIDPTKARELIIDLSTYLRHNLEIGDEFISINKEIEQIKAYVEIEKARFADKLNVIYDIDEDINIKIPNLIIQPLVENSIKHGILKGEGKGTVKVQIKKRNKNHIYISIEDDGCGIDSNVIDKIYKGTINENKIGLANVHNRLRLIYGQGLNIQRLSKGTKISFSIIQEE
ncbi:two-component system, LytT family, sensor kinase [Alkalithermobacter thermoalcaliphilus JW-YL-7 = DSM 7308]|uniref:histidine kinase n=1 Tax=Alkalithermobacter thermoalcaliphilus JW-YL-7 = DSM 7308 TaxID=1121328 RepID=A0A150FPA6_CLOPD|nr:signal transduction histidine kinase, LytS [[Clostridium] paradoxum JW-YL-7 = DSM 7308]SHK51141.1 two-component system, LytT family, sensor kinase [[Clostridium] paradoxum JW-YL-7 = DSM 7308]